MDTKVALVKDINKDMQFIKESAECIKNGGIVAFPTETVYGLGADALNPEAVKKIFEAKGRPQDNPLIVHVASKDISSIAQDIPEVAEKLMDKFWPGPMTIILKKKDIIPDETSAKLDTIGIRMPDNEIAAQLIKLSGKPIAAPSANISGRPSPTDMERCVEDLMGKVDYIIGGSESRVGVESTIVDCSVYPPVVLRPGGITIEMLQGVDEKISLDKGLMTKPTEDFKPKAPGMKYRHYAPKAKMYIVEGNGKKTIEKINEMVHNYIDAGKKVGILTCQENKDEYKDGAVINIGSINKLEDIAHNLFESLRKFDDLKVDVIVSEGFEEKGVGIAIMNRLKKAAGYNIIKIND